MCQQQTEAVEIKAETPWVTPKVRAAEGRPGLPVRAILDTGSTKALVISEKLAERMELSTMFHQDICLADGCTIPCKVCQGDVEWLDQWYPKTEVTVMKGVPKPVLGM